MGIARVNIEQIERSARTAASSQVRNLSSLRMDVSRLEVVALRAPRQPVETCGVAAADAGQISVMLAPFHLELLHVADHSGRVHLTEFFPLTTLAQDLRAIFQGNAVLSRFAERLGCKWDDLSDLWETSGRAQPPMPRDVRLVADTLREIAEWAVAMELACEGPPADPGPGEPVTRLVLHDGMLRSITLRNEVINARLPAWWRDTAWKERRVAIAGVGKSSMVWQRLALSLSLDSRVRGAERCYVVIPPDFESALTRHPAGRRLGFGQMVLVKTRDDELGQLLPVDLPPWILADRDQAEAVLGTILHVSQTTFPMAGYPAPLESAHEASRLSEFDSKIVRDMLVQALAAELGGAELEQMLRYWAFQSSRWPKAGRIGRD